VLIYVLLIYICTIYLIFNLYVCVPISVLFNQYTHRCADICTIYLISDNYIIRVQISALFIYICSIYLISDMYLIRALIPVGNWYILDTISVLSSALTSYRHKQRTKMTSGLTNCLWTFIKTMLTYLQLNIKIMALILIMLIVKLIVATNNLNQDPTNHSYDKNLLLNTSIKGLNSARLDNLTSSTDISWIPPCHAYWIITRCNTYKQNDNK